MRRRDRLGWRLLISHLTVVLVGSIALLLATAAVATRSFESVMGHTMVQMGEMGPEMEPLLRAAFREAIDGALFVAAGVAAIAAVIASIVLASRISRPLERLADASRRVASGSYAERVATDSAGEIGELARSFNMMAASLDATEVRRRQLVDDVAHELRTPLATLDGYLEGLEDGIVPPGAPTWTILRTETSRLTRLVDDLQELWRAEARQTALEIGSVHLATVATDMTTRFAPRAVERGVDVRARIDTPDLVVAADERRLSQVVDNLMSNAIRYSEAGSSITVLVQRVSDYGVIAICDHGRGLDDAELGRVFERFYRADPARSRLHGGSGLGLAISKALVDLMGGSIHAESQGHGTGSTFSVALPLSRA